MSFCARQFNSSPTQSTFSDGHLVNPTKLLQLFSAFAEYAQYLTIKR